LVDQVGKKSLTVCG